MALSEALSRWGLLTTGPCSSSTRAECYCRLRCPPSHPLRDTLTGKTCSDSSGNQCDLGYCKDPASIVSGMPSCAFNSDATSPWSSGGAELKLATSSSLNFEATTTYQINIKATDGGFSIRGVTSLPLSGLGIVTINVRDVNEAPFLANSPGGAFNVKEDKSSDFSIGSKLVATDEDAGQLVSYTIISETPDDTPTTAFIFKIEPDGQLKINLFEPLDYEVTPQYTLEVRVTDNGVPVLSSLVDATIVINVLDVNEKPVLSDAVFSVNENSARNTLVGTELSFVDPDAGQVHSFSILPLGNEANFFTISADKGQISVNRVGLDFEQTPTYSLKVKIRDSGDPVLDDEAAVTINLINQNDPPLFSAYDPSLALEIDENVAQNVKTSRVGT